jgi:hypothetical protein
VVINIVEAEQSFNRKVVVLRVRCKQVVFTTVAAFSALIVLDDAQSDDRPALFYSGYGAQISNTEADRIDEYLSNLDC